MTRNKRRRSIGNCITQPSEHDAEQEREFLLTRFLSSFFSVRNIHATKWLRFSSHDSTMLLLVLVHSRHYHRPVSCPLSSRQFQRRGEEEEEEGGERDEG